MYLNLHRKGTIFKQLKIMKHLILLFIVFSCCILHAQNDNTESRFKSGVALFPNFSIPTMQVNSGGIGFKNYYPKFSYGLTYFAEFALKEKIILGFGLGYYNTGDQTKKIPLTFYNQTSQSLLTTSEVRFVTTQHNIEVPIYLKFKFGNRFHAFVGVGGVLNLYNSQSTTIYELNGKRTDKKVYQDKSTEFRNLNINATIGFGVDYVQTEKIALFIDLKTQVGVLGIAKNTPVNYRYLSLGISTGIRF